MNIIIIAMYVATVLLFISFIRNISDFIFGDRDTNIHRKRMKDLDFQGKRIGESSDSELKNFLDKATSPLVEIISPKLKPMKMEQLQRKLEYVKLDSYFTAEQFRVLQLMLSIASIILGGIAAKSIHPVAGLIIFGLGTFLPGFMLNNDVANKKDRIFNDFPEFIQIVQGYIVADIPLTEAIRNSIDYVGEEWKEYLREFVVNSNVRNLDFALSELQRRVDILEVSELLSLIRMSIDQGIDVQEALEGQTDKVKTMQLDVMMSKIEKRKLMTLILQGPLLLTIIVAFGLPTIQAMTQIG